MDLYVASISDKMILGLDFMTKHNVIIDFKGNTLHIQKETVPIYYIKEDTNRYQISRVILAKKTVVPPNTMVRTKVKLSTQLNDEKDYVITSKGENKTLLVPNILVKGNQVVSINLVNVTDSFVHLNKKPPYMASY